MANIFQPEFDEERTHDGFRAQRARVGRQLETQRLGASVWEVEPGQAAYPLHYHLGDEELVIVLAGRPSLRGPEGWRDLEPGEAISFARGERGAHQIANRTTEPVRFLAVSTNGDPDVVIYPDANKIAATERLPAGGGFGKWFRVESAVEYHDGEVYP